MRLCTRGLPAAAATACLLAVALTRPSVAEPAAVERLSFEVLLDGREIGYHRFSLSESSQGRVIESEADFEVKVLFFTAFAYQHSNTEVWQGDCLAQIDARTRSNGKQFEVNGREQGDRFVLRTQKRDDAIDGCVRSFAYWDRDLLEVERLLNPQTGEYLAVSTEALPAASLSLDGREIAVERVALSAKDLDITLSYARGTGEWLGLDSTVQGGRTLSYRRVASELDEVLVAAMPGSAPSSGVLR